MSHGPKLVFKVLTRGSLCRIQYNKINSNSNSNP